MSVIDYPPFNDIDRINESSRAITHHLGLSEIVCMLGTGFYPENPPWKELRKISCRDIPHFPKREGTYHEPDCILASSGMKDFLVMTGRYHFYEGFSLQEVGYPVRVLAQTGIKTIILTSACGGINPDYNVGDYVIVEDHVNLLGLNPLIGQNIDDFGPRFPNLLEGYSSTLINKLQESGRVVGLQFKKGILGYLPGPCFESRAELDFLKRNNIDLIGWSSVPEAIVACHAGLDMVSIAVVSDISDPLRAQVVSEGEVLQGAKKNSSIFAEVLCSVIENL